MTPRQRDSNAGDTAHGQRTLPHVTVDNYSLELRDAKGLLGDQASETAFREILKGWRQTLEQAGPDVFGAKPAEELSKDELDRIAASGDTEAARVVALAVDEFSGRLACVIENFMQHEEWRDVQRIVIGGGFKESGIGRLAIKLASHRLAGQGRQVELRPLRHAADDGGLAGWAQLLPSGHRAGNKGQAFLAVDIGGTNVRCGIVECSGDEIATARVTQREKWRHADDDAPQNDLVEGIVDMLGRLIAHADQHGIRLSPFIGVGCPGVIRSDGSIERGAQNLPGDWERASFHLPRRLCENISKIDGEPTLILMHNDAVVQGLSELPYTRDVDRWAILTIGTGLGNAVFTNRP